MINLALLGRVVSRHLRYSAKAASLRGMLAADKASIMHAEKLRNIKQAPQTPFIAIRRGGFGSSDGVVQTGVFRLYCYDHPDEDYWRLNQIAAELGSAFDVLLDDPGLALDRPLVATVGDETADSELNLLLVVCELSVAGV